MLHHVAPEDIQGLHLHFSIFKSTEEASFDFAISTTLSLVDQRKGSIIFPRLLLLKFVRQQNITRLDLRQGFAFH